MMLNSKPNNSKYHQGNYIPKYKDKVLKLNEAGGLYYRSSWEKKIMHWLDHNENIKMWGAECIKIPYQVTKMENGDLKLKTHTYYPDFFYRLEQNDGTIKDVVVEVKPHKDYEDAILFGKGQFKINENLTLKKLKNLEYRFKNAQKNHEKWENMIKWCNKKGYDFIIITEKHLNKFNV